MTPKLIADLLFAASMANTFGVSYALVQISCLLVAEFRRRRTEQD